MAQNTANVTTTTTTTDDNVNGPPVSTSIPITSNSSEDVVDGEMRDHWITNNEPAQSRFRFSSLNKRHGTWTCFVCCHVRTGTIVIGFWHVMLELMALSLIAIAVVHPEMLTGQKHMNDRLSVGKSFLQLDVQSVNCTRMPCLLAAQATGRHQSNSESFHPKDKSGISSDYPLVLRNIIAAHRINSEDVNVGIFITICMFVVTLLLVYGAFSGQPSHLMPFFFLQVFDFCIASMTMIGYLAYLPNVRQIVKDFPVIPLQQMLLSMNIKCLVIFVMLMCATTFLVKAYCISIIWRCYKFLMLRTQRERHFLANAAGPVDQESQTLVLGHDLPDYNTAMADPQYRKKISSLFPDPPPSYDMAMAALFSQTVELPPEQHGSSSSSSDNVSSTVPLLHPSRTGVSTNNSTVQSPASTASMAAGSAVTTTANM